MIRYPLLARDNPCLMNYTCFEQRNMLSDENPARVETDVCLISSNKERKQAFACFLFLVYNSLCTKIQKTQNVNK